jgi:hypothetical protein
MDDDERVRSSDVVIRKTESGNHQDFGEQQPYDCGREVADGPFAEAGSDHGLIPITCTHHPVPALENGKQLQPRPLCRGTKSGAFRGTICASARIAAVQRPMNLLLPTRASARECRRPRSSSSSEPEARPG